MCARFLEDHEPHNNANSTASEYAHTLRSEAAEKLGDAELHACCCCALSIERWCNAN